MSQDGVPERPRTITVLTVIYLTTGLLLLGFGGFLAYLGGVRAAVIFGLSQAVMVLSGTYGMYTGTTWGRGTLGAGLVSGVFCAALVLIFGLIVGQTDFAMWANIASGVAVVVLGLAAIPLRSATVETYMTELRLAAMDGPPETDLHDTNGSDVAFDFQSESEAAELVPDEVEEKA